jgi:hypothetical protein
MPEESSISAKLNEANELLKGGEANDGSIMSSSFMNEMNKKVVKMVNTIRHLESQAERVSEKESRIHSLLHSVNTRQLENLVERLKSTVATEMKIREQEGRERQKQAELVEKNRSEKPKSYEPSVTDDVVVEITATDLAERLDTDVIMGKSEEEMKKWILTLIEEESDLYKKQIFDLAPRVDTSGESNERDTGKCPSLSKIVQKVQQALNDHADDGIGKRDHAQGASVVHWLTSETHSPFSVLSGNLGSVWWNKFIPQDWERLLPNGWEKWDVGIPSYVYHSLVRGCGVYTIFACIFCNATTGSVLFKPTIV